MAGNDRRRFLQFERIGILSAIPALVSDHAYSGKLVGQTYASQNRSWERN